MPKAVVQKLNKRENSELKLAIRYFAIVAAISNVHLTPRQIELLAFTAIKGTISSGGARKDFVEGFGSSRGTLENMKHLLVKKGFIIKQDGRYRIVPSLALDFKNTVVLQVKLELNQDGQSEDREDQSKETS
jgi:hypothetical protein